MYSEKKMHFVRILDSLGLMVVCGILSVALGYQLIHHDMPCPLCLLQRVGLILAGFGFFYNLRLGNKGSHYASVNLACILTGGVSVRQILLHIKPGDPGYSSALFGIHFYTWCLVATVILVVIVASIMILTDLSDEITIPDYIMKLDKPISAFMCWLFGLILVTNLVLVCLECGAGSCADNPVTYMYLLH